MAEFHRLEDLASFWLPARVTLNLLSTHGIALEGSMLGHGIAPEDRVIRRSAMVFSACQRWGRKMQLLSPILSDFT